MQTAESTSSNLLKTRLTNFQVVRPVYISALYNQSIAETCLLLNQFLETSSTSTYIRNSELHSHCCYLRICTIRRSYCVMFLLLNKQDSPLRVVTPLLIVKLLPSNLKQSFLYISSGVAPVLSHLLKIKKLNLFFSRSLWNGTECQDLEISYGESQTFNCFFFLNRPEVHCKSFWKLFMNKQGL